MLRKLALLLVPLAFFVAACGSDDSGDNSPDGATPQSSATEAIEPTSSPPGSDVEPTPVVIATADLGDDPIDIGDGEDDPSAIISALNPLSFLNSLDSAVASDGASPELAVRLLTSGDVPSGYLPMGEFSMNIPSAAGSSMNLAMSMFASGDIATSGQLGSMVMSAVIVVPPEARAEMGDLDELANMTEEDLDEMMSDSGLMGIGITDLRLLDASGLGEGGAAIHMEMDLAEMGGLFGAPAEGEGPAGLATDMYMFFEGDYMQMVMVMYPTGYSSGVDARQLADILDSRA